jgi:hypothetical protein
VYVNKDRFVLPCALMWRVSEKLKDDAVPVVRVSVSVSIFSENEMVMIARNGRKINESAERIWNRQLPPALCY